MRDMEGLLCAASPKQKRLNSTTQKGFRCQILHFTVTSCVCLSLNPVRIYMRGFVGMKAMPSLSLTFLAASPQMHSLVIGTTVEDV